MRRINGHNVGPAATQDNRRISSRRPHRVYVSCPLPLFGTVRYDTAVRALRHLFKRAVFLLPDQLFKNREEWLARWYVVSRDLSDLVILTDGAGYIGLGGFTEVQTARARGARVWLLSRDHQLVPFHQIALCEPDESDWCRYCQITIRPTEAAG